MWLYMCKSPGFCEVVNIRGVILAMHFVPSVEARHLVSFTGTSPATPMQAMHLTLTSPEGMSLICWLIPLTCTLPMPTISIYVCMYVCMYVCIYVCMYASMYASMSF